MTSSNPWIFFLLGVQWLALLPLTVYASERFEDMYRILDEEGEPALILRADPHAPLHFGVLLGALTLLGLLVLGLRHRQGPGGGIVNVLSLLPPLFCLALRLWVGCLSCAP